jgi:hypothetical protein
MEKNDKRVINDTLPFTPMCPHCGCAVSIEKDDIGGYYVKCKNCNDEWGTSPFSIPHDEVEWLEKFHFVGDGEKMVQPVQAPANPPPPTNAKVLMEIAHSSEVLKKAYEMVSDAYKLVNSDKVASKYIHFHSEVTWLQFVWDILMSQYNKDNPDSKEVYHLRAFDFYGIQPGMYVTDGCVDGQG